MATLVDISNELRSAVRCLSSRGLNVAAKWASEMLCGISTDTSITSSFSNAHNYEFDAKSDSMIEDSDMYLFAKSLFDCRELQRAAHILDAAYPDASSYPNKPFFLRCYALYLSGEKQKESQRGDNVCLGKLVNQQLSKLHAVLQERSSTRPLDPFLLYLQGVVARDLGLVADAKAALLASVSAYPLNWSAWVDLGTLTSEEIELLELTLPDHWMSELFKAHICTEIQSNNAALELYGPISAIFPRSAYVQAQTARCFYNLRQFKEAATLLTPLTVSDPFRVDDVDILSNIYYVSDDRPALSMLAYRVMSVDRYRPEVCCVIGNFYSLRNEHEKAICYFRRALRLNAQYLAAWTLMGHEYVELKNTAAAIECYRRAVDINPKDYRAWYGLGQTYELLQQHAFATYYYKKAVTLRPYDPRMWCALGVVCENAKQKDEAIACYMRASMYHDADGIALLRLAKLYSKDRNDAAAAEHYKQYVAQDPTNKAELAAATLFLAKHYTAARNTALAEQYITRALEMPLGRVEQVQAKQIMAEIVHLQRDSGINGASTFDMLGLPTFTPSVAASGGFSNISGVSGASPARRTFSASYSEPTAQILHIASAIGSVSAADLDHASPAIGRSGMLFRSPLSHRTFDAPQDMSETSGIGVETSETETSGVLQQPANHIMASPGDMNLEEDDDDE